MAKSITCTCPVLRDIRIDPKCPAHGEPEEEIRSEIARLLTHRCNNCYRRLPGAIGCSVNSPGWNWITSDFGPFCDDCAKEITANHTAYKRLLLESKTILGLLVRIIENREWGAIEEIADSFREAIEKAEERTL